MSEPPALLVRAVLDTNVLVRGLARATGPSGRLLRALSAGDFALVISEPLLGELEDVLRRPRIRSLTGFDDLQIRRALRALRRVASVWPGSYLVEMVRTDPKDNAVVACALEGGADYIVTADKRDLLSLKVVRVRGFRPVQMVRPSDFRRHLGPRR